MGFAWYKFFLSLNEAYPLPTLLLAFAVVDVAMGIACAIDRSEVNSSINFRGISRKIGMGMIVSLCYMMQSAQPEIPLGSLACLGYIGKEGMSIIENAVALDIPVPQIFIEAVDKANRQETSPKRALNEIKLSKAQIKTDSLIVKSRDTDMVDIQSDSSIH